MYDDISMSSIYLNVVARINEDYEELRQHLKEMDLRVMYLRIFEMSLSLGCTQPLWTIPTYSDQAKLMPLPADPYESLPFETFRAWVSVYELVMRDQGLVGKKPVSIDEVGM